MSRLRFFVHPNLTALLAVLALLDLVGRRMLVRMFLPHSLLSASANRTLMAMGSFVGHLCTVLALLVILLALASSGNRRQLFPGAVQISLLFITTCFSVLVVRYLLQPFQDRFSIYLQISYGFLALFVLIGLWQDKSGPSVPLPARVGATLFVWPAFAGVLVVFCDRAGLLREGPLLAWLARVSDVGLLCAATLAPWLLTPNKVPGRRGLGAHLVPGLAGALIGIVGAAAFLFRFDLVQSLARYGLRVVLPPPNTVYGYLYALLIGLGLAGAVRATLRLWAAGSSDRLIAYGLILVLAGGNPDAQPVGLVLSLVGFLALGIGLRRRALPALGSAEPPSFFKAEADEEPGEQEGRGKDGVQAGEPERLPILS